ncbi:hypothetical protein ACOY7W_04460 [Enterobacter asburiae]|uniref:hypothetical protein n=1 Tax=Enterobacter asburiae TaxID=61645 RepID=UPI003BEF2ADE
MSVKRYEVNGPSSVFEDENGSLVDYEDYAALESRCLALAAENAGLNSAFNPEEISEEAVDALQNTAEFDWDSNDTGSWSWIENDTDVIRAVLEAIKPETPATDAFLAEVRASAVEEFVRMADYSESVADGEVIVTSSSVFAAGHEFAAQLRKGVQS